MLLEDSKQKVFLLCSYCAVSYIFYQWRSQPWRTSGASIFGSLLLIDRTLVRNWRSTWRNVNKRWRKCATLSTPLYSTSPVPLAEMISSGHTSAEISYLLHKWSLDTKKTLGSVINIGQIEIYFSWALIHCICNVFLKCDINSNILNQKYLL